MNPWGAKTLEWTVPNPIPLENFGVLPVVTEDPYGYGEPEPAPSAPEREPERTPEGVPVGASTGAGQGRPPNAGDVDVTGGTTRGADG
jgi:cytochrome c oxidase subunit 1